MTYIKRLLTEWSSCRIIRGIAGLSFIIYGIQVFAWPVILFGLAWLAAGFFSLQCCSSNSCYANRNGRSLPVEKNIDFEEIK